MDNIKIRLLNVKNTIACQNVFIRECSKDKIDVAVIAEANIYESQLRGASNIHENITSERGSDDKERPNLHTSTQPKRYYRSEAWQLFDYRSLLSTQPTKNEQN